MAISHKVWEMIRKAQLMHVTLTARTDDDYQLLARFHKYLESADEADLPRLGDGRVPKRVWQHLVEIDARKGVVWTPEEIMQARRQEEDHPAIKELAGREPQWWQEDFVGEPQAEQLRRYSPWRREAAESGKSAQP